MPIARATRRVTREDVRAMPFIPEKQFFQNGVQVGSNLRLRIMVKVYAEPIHVVSYHPQYRFLSSVAGCLGNTNFRRTISWVYALVDLAFIRDVALPERFLLTHCRQG
jgi:hypothetical protein